MGPHGHYRDAHYSSLPSLFEKGQLWSFCASPGQAIFVNAEHSPPRILALEDSPKAPYPSQFPFSLGRNLCFSRIHCFCPSPFICVLPSSPTSPPSTSALLAVSLATQCCPLSWVWGGNDSIYLTGHVMLWCRCFMGTVLMGTLLKVKEGSFL